MAGERPRVYTIPAGAPFLQVLADAVLVGKLAPFPGPPGDPLRLADVTILLPTRRAVRALRETFIARLGQGAAILPAIRTIGDVDEEGLLLDPGIESGAAALALPPAISRLARRLALTRLTLGWSGALLRHILALGPGEPLLIPASATDATRLAADLDRLLDDLQAAGIDRAALEALTPDDHADYFRIALDFLKIIFERWPEFLADKGLVDPIARRDQLIRTEAERLRAAPPSGPLIAAGSTGSIPATAELLKTIAGLDNGAVVLPGLDQDLDDAGWNAIGAEGPSAAATYGHPQYGMKQLVAAIGIPRGDVAPLGAANAAIATRARLVSEALRPADTTELWAAFRKDQADAPATDAALAGVTLLLAHNEQEEAVAIAIAIREALDQADTTVAVVTPDRTIARRVAAELGRWRLQVDDSAGARLDLLPEGIFARLLVEAVAARGEPAKLLAVLKHPAATFGMDRFECRRAARMLELALFRGRHATNGIARLGEALAETRRVSETEGARHIPAARKRLNPSDWTSAAWLVERIARTLGPLEVAFKETEITAAGAARLLLDALHLAAVDKSGSEARLWNGAGGSALVELLAGIAEEGGELVMRPADVPSFLAAMMADVSVTRSAGADPRVHIWGTLEARLQSVDLLILAGLDEGVWPTGTRTDPWLSRAMRTEIGLPPPERRIGLSAHDFAEGFAAPRVIVTRAEKRGGAPTVASRWLQRLAALLGAEAWTALKKRGDRFVDLARHIDRVEQKDVRPVGQPKPTPPVAVRPRRLAVTEIETLVRDPYAIYARHILHLERLDPLGRAPDYALRGSLIHDALGRFVEEWRGPFDRSAEARLGEIGRETLAEIAGFQDVHTIWSNRFAAIARWIVEWEAGRDQRIATRHGEISGAMTIAAPAGDFLLYGRADRIDVLKDGTLSILDFKTGTPPTAKQILTGNVPQLGLEAAMAHAGAFAPIAGGLKISELGWIGLGKIGRTDPFSSAYDRRDTTADQIAETVFGQFTTLIAAFDDPSRPYQSWTRPMFERRYESPYDHLARVREWGLVNSEEDLAWQPPVRPG